MFFSSLADLCLLIDLLVEISGVNVLCSVFEREFEKHLIRQ